jgi:hypothetical protein
VVGTIDASGLAKLGGQRSDSSHQPSASLASYVPERNHPTATAREQAVMLLQARSLTPYRLRRDRPRLRPYLERSLQ